MAAGSRHAERAGWIISLLLITPANAQAVLIDSPQSDFARSLDCMATAIAYEAGFEPIEGQQAVGEVILNRVRLSGYIKSVCDIVYAGSQRSTGCQFTFACDGALRRRPLPNRVLAASRLVAESELLGTNPVRVAGASHYHADYVNPYWASSLVRVAKIGSHIFYRTVGASRVSGRALFPLGASETKDAMAMARLDVVQPSSTHPANPQIFAPWGLIPSTSPR